MCIGSAAAAGAGLASPFASFEETRYLLASPKNAMRLHDSIAELDKGEGRERDLAEPHSKK